jgi:hypothetical protein
LEGCKVILNCTCKTGNKYISLLIIFLEYKSFYEIAL